ncbi:type IV secretion system DNA-binding domain-containing protein [Micromonospora sp. Llam7]|uniref:type IV secretory system conjugative DNA transfer family protein n=1 Tax=Micromonospora tarapacensis TaxID=2835305 RepID=UPI001C83A599|nr:type IV secretory system conjugative DNA transfer family protein [Micromonospora tarapacensis]MBX7268823.1 type IV secretion system DNA-binding domain-containing protein [Micromonospora tarapacensis]
MMLTFLIALGGAAVFGLILGSRWMEAQTWRRQLVAYRLRPAQGLTADQVSAWLGMVASASRRRPVAFELVATHKGIGYYVLLPVGQEAGFLAQIRSALPGVRVEEAPEHFSARPAVRAASELRLTSTARPLAHERAEAAITALLSGLNPFARGEVVRVQWILSGTRAVLPSSGDSGDIARAIRNKHAAPVFAAVGRVAVTAPTMARAVSLLNQVTNAFRVLDTAGVSTVRRSLPTSIVASRVYARALPITVWPVRLNAKEAVGVLSFPLGNTHMPGLDIGRARQLPPAEGMAARGTALAESNYPSSQGRHLVLKPDDRLRHLHVLGPTGVGKSTLIANAVRQDIERGDGLVLIDPKSDLVDDVLARVPDGRTKDMLVLDPSSTDFPVGFNVLQVGKNEHERELVVDHVVHVFSELWRSSWGPRTSDVLRTALLTLTHTTALDGSAFTLCEVPELLMNPSFRRYITAQTSVPDTVRSFWNAYEQMSDGERTQVIGPSLNKLRALTTRTSLRLMLGQSTGIEMAEVFRSKRVILVPLSKGTVGTETAHLLGSLLMAALWQSTLARAAIPAARRRPVWAYLDEFQDVLRLGSGNELADMLAQARGLGLGLVLAHQYLDQLPKQVQAAVLGTARSQIVFQCEYDDARALEKRYSPALSAADLMGLDAYEIAMRPCVDGQTRIPVTGKTLPLPDALRDPRELARASRERFGVPRADVEAALRSRVETGNTSGGRIGRTRRGGSS